MPPCKINELLAVGSSPITKAMRALYDLLLTGSNDADHAVWGLLHLLDAPLNQQAFQRYCQGQTLRMLATVHRRYAVKYSGWPYLLGRLYIDGWSYEERQQVATALHVAALRDRPLPLGHSTSLRTKYSCINIQSLDDLSLASGCAVSSTS